MIGHQREILASLGIDIWIPRDAASQNLPASSLWRDQAPAELLTEIVMPAAVAATVPQDIALQLRQPVAEPQVSPQENSVESPAEPVTPAAPLEVQPALQIDAFHLQAIATEQYTIVLDATNINETQQQLWRNIQRAAQAEFFELNWPFALPELQDGRAVSVYVQGFLDAIALEKKIIVLGQLPHVQLTQATALPTLAEMLEQPLLKKQLWQAMQDKKHMTDQE
ncbi:hypothetical protein [Acinetobacter indicus]|mgnify:FL=1|uniref:hypothetical protein n=1 Tax=Acinetobacter indicus TaxID=756892 RepID=UPI0032B41AA7